MKSRKAEESRDYATYGFDKLNEHTDVWPLLRCKISQFHIFFNVMVTFLPHFMW